VQVGGLRAFTNDCPAVRISSTRQRSQVPFLFFDVYPGLVLYKRTVALPALGVYVASQMTPPRPYALLPYMGGGRIWKLPAYYCRITHGKFDSAIRGRRNCGLDMSFVKLTRLPQGCLFRGLGALATVLSPWAFIGLSYSDPDVPARFPPRRARSPAVSDRDPGGFGFRLTPSYTPSLRA